MIGNGTDNEHRSNAFKVYADGHAEVQTVGTSNNAVATKNYVDSAFTNLNIENGTATTSVVQKVLVEDDPTAVNEATQ